MAPGLAAIVPVERQQHADAVEIFDCKFDRKWDVNYDNWPDKWERQLGPALPHYVAVAIEPDATAPDDTCLTVHVNGGGAYLASPRIPVSDKFSYKVEARLRVAGLRYARAQVRVEFCGEDGGVFTADSRERARPIRTPSTCSATFGHPGQSQMYSVNFVSLPSASTVRSVTRGMSETLVKLYDAARP